MTTSKNATASFHTTEEISILLTTLNSLLAKRSPEKFSATLAIFQALLTLLNPICREGVYLKTSITRSISECHDDLEKLLESLIYVNVIDLERTLSLSTDARWIVDTTKSLCRFITEIKKPQKNFHVNCTYSYCQLGYSDEWLKERLRDPKSLRGENHQQTVKIEEAERLMEERNTIITALAFSRISEGGSTIFDTAAAERLKQLFVPGEDVYNALLHYHSRLMFYSLKVGFESPLLSDLKAILYAGMPKTYLEFDEKVDKEIVFLFAEGGEKQRSK